MNENWYYDDENYPEEIPQRRIVWASQDINAPLMVVNYNDKRFKPGIDRILFGREEEGLDWNYNDRLWEWDYKKAQQSNLSARNSGVGFRTPLYYQEFLRAYFDQPNLELVCIKGGYNAQTLSEFHLYGYRVKQ
jgi:hypothetical protein